MKKICMILIASLVMTTSLALATDIVFITNKSNSVDSISAKDVKKIYLGKMSNWNNGATIQTFSQTNSDLSNVLVKKYVKKSPQQYFLYWQNAVFTGKGTPPLEVDNDAQMKARVASRSGAIGFISAGALDGSVKKLSIY